MSELDTRLAPRELETINMGGDEIDEQESAEKVAAGKYGHGNIGARDIIEDEKGAEELLLHAPDTELHLSQSGPSG